ncbi:MAG TPA: hypothetical protein VFF73_31040 [Planctomycetota bacterium]|nr:hypothetical protein [Planctomycetota bacterium]
MISGRRARLVVAIAVAAALALGAAVTWVLTHPRPPRFVDALEKAVRAMPPSGERAVGLAWLAWTRAELGETPRARALAVEAEKAARSAEREGERATALGRVAAALERAGDRSHATELFSEALELSTTGPPSRDREQALGSLLTALGDVGGADAALVARVRDILRARWPEEVSVLRPLRRLGLSELAYEHALPRLLAPETNDLRGCEELLRPFDPSQDRDLLPEAARARIIAAVTSETRDLDGYFDPTCLVMALRGDEDPERHALALARDREAAGLPLLGAWLRISGLMVVGQAGRVTRPEAVEEALGRVESLGASRRRVEWLPFEFTETIPALAPGERGIAIVASLARFGLDERERSDAMEITAAATKALAKFPPSAARMALARELARDLLDRHAMARQGDASVDSTSPAKLFEPILPLLGIDPSLAESVSEAALRACAPPHLDGEDSLQSWERFYWPRSLLARCAHLAAGRGDLDRARAWFVASGKGSDAPDVDPFDSYLVLGRRILALTGMEHDLRNELGASIVPEIVRSVSRHSTASVEDLFIDADRAIRSPVNADEPP